jgi:hypothetical protein
MRAGQTLAGPRERVASVRDLRSPVINVARLTAFHSSLQQAGQFCVVIVSVLVAPLSREPSIDLRSGWNKPAILKTIKLK